LRAIRRGASDDHGFGGSTYENCGRRLHAALRAFMKAAARRYNVAPRERV
jgi:hypothetical protein